MAYDASFFYTIIREADFDEKMARLVRSYRRTAELDEAIDWALSRRPHYFTAITDEYYIWVTERIMNDDFPQLKILYRIKEDERTVYLIDVEEV